MIEWIISSSALILLVLAVRSLAKNRLSCRARYCLWLLVLARLLVPAQLFTTSWGVAEATLPENMTKYSIYVLPVGIADAIPVETAEGGVELKNPFAADSFGYSKPNADGTTYVTYADIVTPAQLLRAVWLAGVGVMAAVLLVSNVRFARRLRRTRVPCDALIGGARVYVAERLASPCLVGVLRPTVYLTPECARDERALRHVLAHETTHRLHGDCLWSLLRLAALCLHWYNPLVWCAVIVSKRDGELACDEATLARLGEDERAAYGETLLSMVTARPRGRDLLSASTAMTAGKKPMRERIETIARHPRTKGAALALALAVLLTATVFAFSKAETPGQESAPMTEEEALDALEASVEWEHGNVSFTIPEAYEPAENWGFHIAGRAVYDDGMSMSMHYFEGEEWQPGATYTIGISNLTELIMQAALVGRQGGLYERVINLLPRHEWYFDLDGDGRSERLTIDGSRLANATDASPVRLYDADGALIEELGYAGQSHVGWATYALTNRDGRTYLLQYEPTMYQGEAAYRYRLMGLRDGALTVVESGEAAFSANPGHEDENDTAAMRRFQTAANDLWAQSRLLFTTDQEVLSHLYDADSGADVSTNGRYYIAPAGMTARYRETMYGMIPEPPKPYDEPIAPAPDIPADELFAAIAGDYLFLSGAGGWRTELTIGADGAFTGAYSSGSEYSAFSGRFGDMRRINAYTWSMRLTALDAGAYGVEGADEVLVYLPGAPVDALPEEFVQWYCAGLSYGRRQIGDTLPTVGLYNVAERYGWFARSLIDGGWEPLTADELDVWVKALGKSGQIDDTAYPGLAAFVPESGERLNGVVRLESRWSRLLLSGEPSHFQIISFTER